MRFLKNLLSFMIPLIIVLSTFALHNAIGNIVDEYKKTINNDYSIMVIANTPIIKDNIKTLVKPEEKILLGVLLAINLHAWARFLFHLSISK